MKLKKKICLECGQEFPNLGKHVQNHGMTSKEYYDKYLKKEGEGICSVCKQETPFKKISQGYAAYCCFEHFKISDLVKQHRETTNLSKFGVKNCFQSAACMKKAEETKLALHGNAHYRNDEQIKKTCKERYGVDNPGKSPLIITKIADTMQKHFGGHNMQNAECRKRAHTRYVFDGIRFDSSYEIAFYIYHRDMKHNITRDVKPFSYIYENKEHKYFPDFKIDDTYYEIKGNHLLTPDKEHFVDPHKHCVTGLLEAKMACLRKNKIVLLTNDEISFYICYVKQTYGSNYLKSFKTKVNDDKSI